MEDRKYEIIMELMDELGSMMKPSAETFSERLGRKKPDVEVVKIEGEMDPELEAKEEEIGMDLDGDEEMGEDMDHQMMVESPEEKLKSRLMKLRGA